MNICMVGTGYVGLVTGTCFASLGNNIICVDVDKKKIDNLKKGILPIWEPGLKDMVDINAKEKRLVFTTDIKDGIEKSDIIFIAVGTPQSSNGEADLSFVYSVAESIGKHINGYKVIVDKSTVPVCTADKVKEVVVKAMKTAGKRHDFDLVSNPEFLREGEAIKDFMNPDRVVIGTESKKSEDLMKKLYSGIERTGKPVIFTDIKSAEMIKYASNAMLATRISFMNMLSRLCEALGGDIKQVAKGMGLDSRIGPRFLQAGVGYGGSCFPKDVRALIKTLEDNNCDASILWSVDEMNEKQKAHIFTKLRSVIPDLKDKTIGIWGLSFKPKTDDIREAPSLVLIKNLLENKAKIKAFDPVAKENVKKIYPEITFGDTPYETIKDCDALVIVTEWDEFRALDMKAVKALLKQPIVIDGRNIYEPAEMKELGFRYLAVGR